MTETARLEEHLHMYKCIFGLALISLSATVRSEVELVSRNAIGAQFANSSIIPRISGNGRYVVFSADLGFNWSVKDLVTGSIQRVVITESGQNPTRPSTDVQISGNGRYAAISTNIALVADDTNNRIDIYLRDLQAQTTTWISRDSSNPAFLPTLDDRGLWISYLCGTTFVKKLCLANRDTAELREFGVEIVDGLVSGNGQYVFFIESDGNTYRQSISGGSPELISIDASGASLRIFDLSVSGDGNRAVALAPTVPQGPSYVWLWNSIDGHAERILDNATPDSICNPAISRDGSVIAFQSVFDTFGPNGSTGKQVYLLNIASDSIEWISRPNSGEPANDSASQYSFDVFDFGCRGNDGAALSSDGGVVAFHSWASNMVAPDTNNFADIFINRRGQTLTSIALPTSGPIWLSLMIVGIALLGSTRLNRRR